MSFLKQLLPLEDLNHWFQSMNLNDTYVQHTLFAFGVLVMGFFGYIIGQRLASYGKLCLLIGLTIGALSVALLYSPYGYFAPGICGVFLVTFLASGLVARLAEAGNKEKEGDSGGAQ